MSRKLQPWEINHLRKYGIDSTNTAKFGTTPVEYLTGHAEFRGLDLFINPSCLIPRQETEAIVDLCLAGINAHPQSNPLIIADVGCGSGALGISLAQEITSSTNHRIHLYMSDISTSAIQVALRNVDTLIPHLKKDITLFRSDLLTQYPPHSQINYLVANLPYIPSARIATLDSSVKDHEPHLALDGGPNGVTLINQLLLQSTPFLAPNALLILEIDSVHTLKDFHLSPDFHAKIKPDIFNRPRYLIVSSS